MKTKTHVINVMSLWEVNEDTSFVIKERIASKSFNDGHRGFARKVKHLPAIKDKTVFDREKKGHWTDPAVTVGETVFPALKHVDRYAAKARFRRDSVNTFERFCTADFTPDFMVVEPKEDLLGPIADVMAQKLAVRLPVAPVSEKAKPVRPPSGTLFERYCSIAAKRRGESPAKARREKGGRDQFLMGLEVYDRRTMFDWDAMSLDDDLYPAPLDLDWFPSAQPDADFFVGNSRVLASSLAARGPVSPCVVPF
jgi:hypothetical protein